MLQKSLALLSSLILCFILSLSAYAQTPSSVTIGSFRENGFYPLSYRSSLAQADVTDHFYYSESFFDHPATEYNTSLALTSLGMALSASTTWESYSDYGVTGDVGRENNLLASYSQLGFSNIECHNYDKSRNDPSDSIAYSFAQKTYSENETTKTILTIFLRGAGYGAEWVSNLHLGDGPSHAGFTTPVSAVYADFQQYLAAAQRSSDLGEVRLWIAGFSRGGTVANLLAAKIMNTLPEFTQQNTFVYTFAASAAITANSPLDLQWDLDAQNVSSSNIFNLINSIDLVSRMLPASWGYHRNGIDLYLPASQYSEDVSTLNALCYNRLDFSTLPTTENVTLLADALTEVSQNKTFYHEHYESFLMDLAQSLNTRGDSTTVSSVPSILFRYRTIFSKPSTFSRLFSLRSLQTLRKFRFCHAPDTYLALLKYYQPEQYSSFPMTLQ